MPLGMKCAFEVGHRSKKRRLPAMVLARISSIAYPSASSMAGAIISLKDFDPKSRSATRPASTMPGTSAAIGPATGIMPFNPPGSVSRISPILSGRVRNISAVADFGMVPTPAIAKILPALVRIRMGASPSHSEMRKLGGGRGEHRGHAGIHRVAAFVIGAHAGLGRVFASGGDRVMRSANGLAHGAVPVAPRLRESQTG